MSVSGVSMENLQIDAGPTVHDPTNLEVLSIGSKFGKNKVKRLYAITQGISDGVGPSTASLMLS